MSWYGNTNTSVSDDTPTQKQSSQQNLMGKPVPEIGVSPLLPQVDETSREILRETLTKAKIDKKLKEQLSSKEKTNLKRMRDGVVKHLANLKRRVIWLIWEAA